MRRTGREIAEILYDQLTGRHTGDPYGENAVLRPVEMTLRARDHWTSRDKRTYALIREANDLGYEVISKVGDRWGLALRLARMVVERE